MLAGLTVDRTHDFHIFSPPLSQQVYIAALPTKIQSRQHFGSNTRTAYISFDLWSNILIRLETIRHIWKQLGQITILKSALNTEETAVNKRLGFGCLYQLLTKCYGGIDWDCEIRLESARILVRPLN